MGMYFRFHGGTYFDSKEQYDRIRRICRKEPPRPAEARWQLDPIFLRYVFVITIAGTAGAIPLAIKPHWPQRGLVIAVALSYAAFACLTWRRRRRPPGIIQTSLYARHDYACA